MSPKVRRLGVAVVLLIITGVLLVDSIGADGPQPEIRSSWQEQLARVQQVMTDVDPDATLIRIYAHVVFDAENILGRNAQNVPFAYATVLYSFDGSFPRKSYSLHDRDIEIGAYYPLTVTTTWGTTEITLDHPIHVAELQSELPIGPFDLCQSSLATTQNLMHSDLGHMYCEVSLNQITSERDFGIPAVWHVTWTNFETRKVLQKVEFWIEPTTGKQLKIKADTRKEM